MLISTYTKIFMRSNVFTLVNALTLMDCELTLCKKIMLIVTLL